MIEINKHDLGAIDNCTPYLATNLGNNSLSNFIQNDKPFWVTISPRDVSKNLLILIFVSYINYNFNMLNTMSRSFIHNKFKADEKSELSFCSINGVLINNTIFINDRYKSDRDISVDIKSNDNIMINHLKVNVQNTNLIGRFDLKKCHYFYTLI